MGISSLPARHWGRIGLAGLLGLTLALAGVAAGQASSRAAGHAVVAKKKCKKKKHRSASSAKKKKCKKKVHRVVLPPPGPVVRATLSWTANNEVDLHAFDASGNQAGWVNSVNGVVNNIPSAHQNGDIGPTGGTESFTDDIYVVGGPSNREFTYVACLFDFPDGDPYSATFSAVARDGSTDSRTLDGPETWVVGFPGGPVVTDETATQTCS
jgi:hypothetical protein